MNKHKQETITYLNSVRARIVLLLRSIELEEVGAIQSEINLLIELLISARTHAYIYENNIGVTSNESTHT